MSLLIGVIDAAGEPSPTDVDGDVTAAAYANDGVDAAADAVEEWEDAGHDGDRSVSSFDSTPLPLDGSNAMHSVRNSFQERDHASFRDSFVGEVVDVSRGDVSMSVDQSADVEDVLGGSGRGSASGGSGRSKKSLGGRLDARLAKSPDGRVDGTEKMLNKPLASPSSLRAAPAALTTPTVLAAAAVAAPPGLSAPAAPLNALNPVSGGNAGGFGPGLAPGLGSKLAPLSGSAAAGTGIGSRSAVLAPLTKTGPSRSRSLSPSPAATPRDVGVAGYTMSKQSEPAAGAAGPG